MEAQMAVDAFITFFDKADGETRGVSADAFDFTTEPTGTAMGDFDGNGDVDGRDFLIWQRGNTSGPDGNDGFLVINWLAEDHADPFVDPNNPNVDPSDPSAGFRPPESFDLLI
jgi:hypothetical protein